MSFRLEHVLASHGCEASTETAGIVVTAWRAYAIGLSSRDVRSMAALLNLCLSAQTLWPAFPTVWMTRMLLLCCALAS
jgi:hypothetical protein